MTLEQIIKNIKMDPDYNLKDCTVDYVKENKDMYLVVFKTDNLIPGKQLIYTYDKKKNKSDMLYIPNENNFRILDSFDELPNIYKK